MKVDVCPFPMFFCGAAALQNKRSAEKRGHETVMLLSSVLHSLISERNEWGIQAPDPNDIPCSMVNVPLSCGTRASSKVMEMNPTFIRVDSAACNTPAFHVPKLREVIEYDGWHDNNHPCEPSLVRHVLIQALHAARDDILEADRTHRLLLLPIHSDGWNRAFDGTEDIDHYTQSRTSLLNSRTLKHYVDYWKITSQHVSKNANRNSKLAHNDQQVQALLARF